MDNFLQNLSETTTTTAQLQLQHNYDYNTTTTTTHFGHRRSEFLANCSVPLFGWIQLRLCLPSVCLLGWNSNVIVQYQYIARCYLPCGEVPELQNGDADDNPDVRLFIGPTRALFVFPFVYFPPDLFCPKLLRLLS